MSAAADTSLRHRIDVESIRLFFTSNTIPGFRQIRYLHLLAVAGAATVGMIVWIFCRVSPYWIAIWCAIFFCTEFAITWLNIGFHARPREERELVRWAWAKTALAGLNAGACSLGPILLYVPGSPVSTLVPAWGIVNFMGAAVWAGAPFAPAMFAMMLGATLPASLWLMSFGSGLEYDCGLCLATSLVFMSGIGWLSAQKNRESLKNRLEIAELLQIKAAQAEQIAAHFAERSRFFSAASHDLRQPLNAMTFYFALLSNARSDGERGEIIDRLQECAASLHRQFEAIMGVSETDAAINRASEAPESLQTLFDKLVLTLAPEAARKNLEVRMVPTRLWVYVDPDLLYRALLNLVANAIKYTERGGVLVGARQRGRSIAIQVVDTGIGIEPQHVATIFDDFFQIGNPERDRTKGLGIGLGVVRRLCAALTWTIRVDSVMGRGTIFTLSVPRALPLGSDARNVRESTGSGALSEDVRVLVVDDDALIRDSLGRLLTSWGYYCRLCANGEEALQILSADARDARWHVLLDWRLAGQENGLAIASRIRERFGHRVQITLMTGDIDPSIDREAERTSVVLLRKPVKPIRLRATLATPPLEESASSSGEEQGSVLAGLP